MIIIKKSLKIIIFVLCSLMMNLVYIKKIYALPQGVRRVEIGNWTKTREVNEIGGEEKKLNSQVFTDIKNINMGDGESNNIEEIINLYDNKNFLSNLETLNTLNSGENKSIITGNKILRTLITTNPPIFGLTYDTIKGLVGSETNITWEEDFLGNKIITWPCYVEIINSTSQLGNIVEWRMIDGKFQLSDEDIQLIKSEKVQPVLGIKTNDDDGFKLICPFNDILSVFIDGKSTNINYNSVGILCKLNLKNNVNDKSNTTINYRVTNLAENKKFCDSSIDDNLSQHTHKKHLDTNILETNTGDGYCRMVGDISQYITENKNNYTISMLVGQIARSGQGISSYNGGISKLDLFLIEKPSINVVLKPYIIKNNEKVYVDSNYKFVFNEKILFDIEIENLSTNYDISNVNLNLNFEDKSTGSNSNLNINKKSATYKNKDITNSIKIYSNDNTVGDIKDLSQLKKGEKLIISSNEFNYTVTEYNANIENIKYDYICEFNYLNDYTFYKCNGKDNLAVKPIGGKLTIKVNSDKDDYFYLKLISEDNFTNIKVKNNETYTICNLDYDKEYKFILINSSSYKLVNSEIFTLKNSSDYNTKYININANQKSNNYFTQRKIDEIILNR